jgi:hypothetical protein
MYASIDEDNYLILLLCHISAFSKVSLSLYIYKHLSCFGAVISVTMCGFHTRVGTLIVATLL